MSNERSLSPDASDRDVATATLQGLTTPPPDWPATLTAHPEWLTLSTLRGLLMAAHDDLDRDPPRSAQVAKLVLALLPFVNISDGQEIVATTIAGTAWKEYGNAVRLLGEHQHALRAADRAIQLFSSNDALIGDRAAATVLKAHVLHDLGDSEAGLRLLDEAASVFAATGEDRRELQTIIMRGLILYECKNFVAAQQAFDFAFLLAERLNDTRELARLANNRGHCALQLGDLVGAWDLLIEAVTAFAAQRMETELPRAHWGLARLMRAHTAPGDTVADLQRVADAFEARGMTVEAASVLLEVANVLSGDEAQRDQVHLICSRLADIFARTSMPREAVAALAHLRQEALAGDDLLTGGISDVRSYFRKLRTTVAPTFAPGH
jgi:tetratricopeptide (TPR) repeat protein